MNILTSEGLSLMDLALDTKDFNWCEEIYVKYRVCNDELNQPNTHEEERRTMSAEYLKDVLKDVFNYEIAIETLLTGSFTPEDRKNIRLAKEYIKSN